jgi:hypothetical protein
MTIPSAHLVLIIRNTNISILEGVFSNAQMGLQKLKTNVWSALSAALNAQLRMIPALCAIKDCFSLKVPVSSNALINTSFKNRLLALK